MRDFTNINYVGAIKPVIVQRVPVALAVRDNKDNIVEYKDAGYGILRNPSR